MKIKKLCSQDGCTNKHYAKSYCNKHFQQSKRGTLNAPPRPTVCKIPFCEGAVKSRGCCIVHYRQVAYLGVLEEIGDAPTGQGRKVAAEGLRPGPKGYMWIQVEGRRVFAHRYVMEQMLGRPLEHGEKVRHIDHDHANNAPENLELFTSLSLCKERALKALVAEAHKAFTTDSRYLESMLKAQDRNAANSARAFARTK